MNRIARLLPLLAATLLGAGCDGSPSASRTGLAARLDIVSGDAQTATAGAELAQPLVVKVVDGKGKPVRGQIVNFRVLSGGGSVYAGSAVTNQDGEARERWTLGNVAADSQRVEARAVDASTGVAQVFGTFRATALPDAPAAVAVASLPATGVVGAALDSLAVVVKDRFGNPVPGVQVSWAVTAGGGSVSPATATSDAAGTARTRWTMGSAVGIARATATVGSATATFQAEVTAGTADLRVTLIGDGQSAAVGAQLELPAGVRVTLPDGRPVSHAPVTFQGQTMDTGLDGILLLHPALPTRAGPVTMPFTAGSVTGAFHFTANPGPPARFLLPVPGSGPLFAQLPVGVQVPVTVQVADQYDNPVPGAAVAWSMSQGTGSVAPAQSTTDSVGKASTRFTAGAYDAANSFNQFRATVAGAGAVLVNVGYTVHAYTARVTPTSPDTLVTSVGATLQLGAEVVDETGQPQANAYQWAVSSSNPQVLAPVANFGNLPVQLDALAPGIVTVTFTGNPAPGSSRAPVTASRVVRVQ